MEEQVQKFINEHSSGVMISEMENMLQLKDDIDKKKSCLGALRDELKTMAEFETNLDMLDKIKEDKNVFTRAEIVKLATNPR